MPNFGKMAYRMSGALGLVLVHALALAPVVQGAPASEWSSDDFTQARLVSAIGAVGDGADVVLGLEFRMDPGWKVYWRSPGAAGFPPRPDWAGSTNLAGAALRWPAPERFSVLGLDTVGYEDEVVFPIAARLEAPGRPLAVRAKVDFLTCSEICIPYTVDLALDLPPGPAVPSAFAHRIERFAERVPGDGVAHGLAIDGAALTGPAGAQVLEVVARAREPFEAPDLFIEGPDLYAFEPTVASLSDGGRTALLRAEVSPATDGLPGPAGEALVLTLVDGGRVMEATVEAAGAGLGVILALALLGGLILNLMPCVLPVLSIKLLAVVAMGGGERRAVRRAFLATAAGVVVSFMVLAGAAVAVKAAGLAVGWGIQFQQPAFLVAMALLVTLFAANLLGLFEIRLPGAAGDRLARAGAGHSLGGHFATGAFATILATPCSAPFLGTAIGFALARGAGEIFAVFAALGLGLALPYLLIAGWPGLATRLPRPGPWMVVLRRVLALALLATGVWLLSILDIQRGTGTAWLVGALMVAVLAMLWLVRRRRDAHRLAGVAILAVLAFLVPAVFDGAARPPAVDVAVLGAPNAAGVSWQPFDRAAIPGLVRAGKTVFVDVTADWCITCKVNKALVLDRGGVATRLGDAGVVAMRADWTNPDAAIAAYLASFGRYGIPFDAVYGPRAPGGVLLPELLTSASVLAAFDQAAGPNALARD